MLPVGQKITIQVQRSLLLLLAIGERRQRRRLLVWDRHTLTSQPLAPCEGVVAATCKKEQISH
jgi:hypothetical protein